MNAILVALMLLGAQNFSPSNEGGVQPVDVAKFDARLVSIISDSEKRFSGSGYLISGHVVQIRMRDPVVYVDYMYTSGPGRGGSGAGACCVSITYEYVAGKFNKSYFAR